jgi:penicillin amidase
MQRHSTLLCLLLAVTLCGCLPTLPAKAQAQAGAASTLTVVGLHKPVIVRRDERDIPHIEATNDADLYFAQGYLTAQDRLWQMDLLRRRARGELAEIFGRVALDEDKRHRTYGFAALADALGAQLPPQTKPVLEAYAAGVNAYIATLNAKTLPPEFQILQYQPRPWRPADSIIIGKIFAEELSTTWPGDLVRAALTDVPADKLALLLAEYTPLDVVMVGNDQVQSKKKTNRAQAAPPDAQTQAALLEQLARFMSVTNDSLYRVELFQPNREASNNWVVAGRRTASGKPLLANDPHLPPSAPSIWYMTHLSAPGVNVAGVTAPGAPGIIIGHNEQIAWGVTNLGPDVQDLYRETYTGHADAQGTAPPRPFYQTPQGPRQVELRREEIKVRKGFADATTETETLYVQVTRHGPIVLDQGDAHYALHWTALDPHALEFSALYNLNRAHNWNEFRAALSDWRGPTQNFVYADVQGHIGYYGAGVIPIRKTGDGSVPYDGATDDGEWTGNIPFAELPHVYDPPSGLIVTANQRVVGRSYPHFLTHEWAAPYRARRIFDLLQAKGNKLTAADFRAVQGDVYSIGGASFAHEAGKLLPNTNGATANAQVSATAAALEAWDGRVDVDSRVAPWVAELRRAFVRRIVTALLGKERAGKFQWDNEAYIQRLITERPAGWLPAEFADYGALMRACYDDARAALAKQLGADEAQWTWGRYAQAQFPHPLAVVPFIGQQFVVPPFPQNGSGGRAGPTVNVGASVSMRLIADPSDWDKTQHGIALGESGLPGTPHWSDQLADWRAVTPHVFPFSKPAVAAATKTTLTLQPTH